MWSCCRCQFKTIYPSDLLYFFEMAYIVSSLRISKLLIFSLHLGTCVGHIGANAAMGIPSFLWNCMTSSYVKYGWHSMKLTAGLTLLKLRISRSITTGQFITPILRHNPSFLQWIICLHTSWIETLSTI